MSPILTSKALISIMGFLLLVHVSTCRPQSTIDSQDPQEQSTQELSRLYNSVGNYNNVQPAFSPEDQLPINRLQMQMLANYVQNNMGGGGWSNDPLYRAPETKRQVRYRQCYFNPISCFKK